MAHGLDPPVRRRLLDGMAGRPPVATQECGAAHATAARGRAHTVRRPVFGPPRAWTSSARRRRRAKRCPTDRAAGGHARSPRISEVRCDQNRPSESVHAGAPPAGFVDVRKLPAPPIATAGEPHQSGRGLDFGCLKRGAQPGGVGRIGRPHDLDGRVLGQAETRPGQARAAMAPAWAKGVKLDVQDSTPLVGVRGLFPCPLRSPPHRDGTRRSPVSLQEPRRLLLWLLPPTGIMRHGPGRR